MSEDLHIGHCDIRIARRRDDVGVWADETEERVFAQKIQRLVLQGLEELIAPHLSGLAENTIIPELAMDLSLNACELSGAAPLARIPLRDKILAAFEAASRDLMSPEPASVLDERNISQISPENLVEEYAGQSITTPIQLLLRWHNTGQLGTILNVLDESALGQLARLTLESGLKMAARKPEPSGPVSKWPPSEGNLFLRLNASPAVQRKALLAFASALAWPSGDSLEPGQAGVLVNPQSIPDSAAFAALSSALLVPGQAGDDPGPDTLPMGSEFLPKVRSAPIDTQSSPRPAHAIPPGQSLANGLYEVDSLLPFPMLQPLSSQGVLDAIAIAGLDAVDLRVLAASLALCARPAADESDCRSESALQAAKIFAGSAVTVTGTSYLAAARKRTQLTEFVMGSIATALLGSLEPLQPLPLIRDQEEYVLFDPNGLYPVMRSDKETIVNMLARANSGLILAMADNGPLQMVRCTDLQASDAGIRANSEHPPRGIESAAQAFQKAGKVWQVLTSGPLPVTVQSLDPMAIEFGRAISTMAGFALADIGWRLFRLDSEAWLDPDPLLVIERFHDLSGTVEVTDRKIIVKLPLGPRFMDLRDAGLLNNLPPAPWWPGREIEFLGG